MSAPSLFFAQGTPMLALFTEPGDESYLQALCEYMARVPRPKAIVIVSSLTVSEDEVLEVSTGERAPLGFGFGGFPGEIYQIEHPLRGDPELSARVAALLTGQGFQVALSPQARIDHGAWIPLRAVFPAGDIPVVQVSLPASPDPRLALKMGRALAPLRREGVAILATGSAVRNDERIVWHGKVSEAPAWAAEFEEWVKDKLMNRDIQALTEFLDEAPSVAEAQPKPEHFMPIFVTVGASLEGDHLDPIFEGVQYGALSMLSFALSQTRLSS